MRRKQMPNWCMNSVTIKGDKAKLDAIEVAAKENKLLEYLVPIGEWEYDKAVNTWGVKWDIHDADCWMDKDNDGSDFLNLNFDSAWGAPIEAFEKAAKNHNLYIKGDYKEDGMMFVGWYRFDPHDREYDNSNLDTYNESFTYDFDDWDTTVDTIPVDLRDTWALDEEYENYKEEMEMEEDD